MPATRTAARFAKGSGVYTCSRCGHKTRATGRGDNEYVGACAVCFDLMGINNHLSDNGSLDGYAGEAQGLFDELAARGADPVALFPAVATALAPATPAVDPAVKQRELLNTEIGWYIKSLESTMAEWAAKFAKDPAYALEWADNVALDACRLKCWKQMQRTMAERPEVTLAQFAKHHHDEGMRAARYASRSTSAFTNVMEDNKRVANFEFAEALTNMVRRYPAL